MGQEVKHPIDAVVWRHRDGLKPNGYNPNKVAPPELQLLKISILEDGWTQPIVVDPRLVIVDGFHRWTVSGHPEIYKLTGGKVPTVTLAPQADYHTRLSTIRHNRARGVHGVLKMAEIVGGLIEKGVSLNEICYRLQMEAEEVHRLANRKGIPQSKIIQDKKWSKAWEPN